MSKKTKIFFVSLLFCVVLFALENFVLAVNNNFSTSQFDSQHISKAETATQNAIGVAINIIRIVGVGISIIMLTYLAITYMMVAPQEKAEFKKSATIYVVGAVLIFAGSNILTMIMKFASEIIKNE